MLWIASPAFMTMPRAIRRISIRINSDLEFIQIKSSNEEGTLVVSRMLKESDFSRADISVLVGAI